MGFTHAKFNANLHELLNDIPYHRSKDTIKFQFQQKEIVISLKPEQIRELSRSVRLPVTVINLRFYGYAEEEMSAFIKLFNLKLTKGGG